MIHGQKNGYGWLGFVSRFFNWTDGCIAVRDDVEGFVFNPMLEDIFNFGDMSLSD